MVSPQGTDIKALDDISDPEEYTTGEENVAYSQARRLLEPPDTNLRYGDDLENDTINLRDWIGKRPTAGDLFGLGQTIDDVLTRDERVQSVTASVEHTQSSIDVSFDETVNDKQATLVLSIDAASSATLITEDN